MLFNRSFGCFPMAHGSGDWRASLNWVADDTSNKMTCAPSEDSYQPGHPPSLIRVFAVRFMGSQEPNASSCGQRRLWSDWVDAQADLSLRWAHIPFYRFRYAVAQLFFSLPITHPSVDSFIQSNPWLVKVRLGFVIWMVIFLRIIFKPFNMSEPLDNNSAWIRTTIETLQGRVPEYPT